MATPTVGHERLAQLIQALPTELFDTTFDFTFTAGEEIVMIDQHYTPPQLLQVNRESRELFATSYYETCTFVGQSSKLQYMTMWMHSLTDEHIGSFRAVRYRVEVELWQSAPHPHPGRQAAVEVAALHLALGQAFRDQS